MEIPQHKPDVVLMDIHLPGESGIACTARLREKMPDLQVIMLTVYKDIKMIFQALKAGACGYVLKRSDEQEILDAIAEVRAGGAPMTSEIARMVVRSFMDSAPIPDPRQARSSFRPANWKSWRSWRRVVRTRKSPPDCSSAPPRCGRI